MNWKQPEPEQPVERRISAGQVNEFPVGTIINMNGEDENGQPQSTECTVAGRSGKKFLTYRNRGVLKMCAIRDYPNKYYTKPL